MVWILAQLNVNLLVAGSFGLVMIAKSVLTRAYKESEARSAEQRAARLKQIEAASQNAAVQQNTTAVAPDTSEQIESNDIAEVIHEVANMTFLDITSSRLYVKLRYSCQKVLRIPFWLCLRLSPQSMHGILSAQTIFTIILGGQRIRLTRLE